MTNKFEKIPTHIAVIMDGNGRWAKKRFMPRIFGHKAGVEALRSIIKRCSALEVKYLTLYAFSTENWNRPADEVNGLMELLVKYLRTEINELHQNQVRINCIGHIDELPEAARAEISKSIEKTKDNKGLTVNIALNYGGRDELKRGIQQIALNVQDGIVKPEEITEEMISNSLYTANQPDPDLLIRTSGELRISNFLLWQLAYTEFYFTEVFWPDFDDTELDKAIEVYNQRNRRYGKV
jgi:undecaprenyl diphosphate synthase